MDKYITKKPHNNQTVASGSSKSTLEKQHICCEISEVVLVDHDENYEWESAKQIKKKRTINYCTTWEQEPELKGWLENSKESEYLAYCSSCSVALKASAGKTDLYKHAKTSGHIKNIRSVNLQPKVTAFEFTGLKKNIMKAELQIAALTAEHNLAFNLSDHLVKMQKNALPDSNIGKGISCNRTKTTAIVKNVLGQQQLDNICNFMKVNKFSICVDESTDLSTCKILSIVVRITKNFITEDYILKLIKVSVADAKTLYSAIIKVFNDQKINYKENLIGFAADGANNMTGKNNSVAALLKSDCPNLLILKCICHSFALCSSYACLKLPPSVETMAREIYNYIENSPKRIAQFREMLVLLEDKPKKLLHPSQTRWLSLEKVVNRLLEFYEPLKIYFAFAVNCDLIETAQIILNNLKNPFNQLYLKFLQFILPQINKLNRIFQSEQPQIHKIHSDIKSLVSTILDYFIKPDYLNNNEIENK